jgi:hypothetical protein
MKSERLYPRKEDMGKRNTNLLIFKEKPLCLIAWIYVLTAIANDNT